MALNTELRCCVILSIRSALHVICSFSIYAFSIRSLNESKTYIPVLGTNLKSYSNVETYTLQYIYLLNSSNSNNRHSLN